jgi:hypothetical protein
MPRLDSWYVSYSMRSDHISRRYSRATQTFRSEDDARRFVRQMASSALRLTSGTINPHFPKRTVTSAEIDTWLETPNQ